MVDEAGRSIDVYTQYIAMHCEATRGIRDTCWEMPKDAPKIKREKLNLFQWDKGFRGMFTGEDLSFAGKLNDVLCPICMAEKYSTHINILCFLVSLRKGQRLIVLYHTDLRYPAVF